MTHTADKITDEPHLIEACSGGKFIVFDGLDCRITINGEYALDAAHEIKKCVNLHDELVEVLQWISDNSMCEGAVFASSEALKKAGAL